VVFGIWCLAFNDEYLVLSGLCLGFGNWATFPDTKHETQNTKQ
jgi:hypothetical protein